MRVFIDIDDTLNSFTMFVLKRHFECTSIRNDFDYAAFEAVLPGVRDMVKVCPLLGGAKWYTTDFWNSMPEWCWSSNPKSHEFDMILDFAQELVPKSQIFIATDVTKNPCCASGKVKWIQQVLPEWLHRNFFITPRKGELAEDGDLLIDDSVTACDWFRKRGGISILVPRPWNSLYRWDTTKYLETKFHEYLHR